MKSIKQAAQEYAARNTVNTGADRTKRENAFKAGVEFAQQWINPIEELPANAQMVILKLFLKLHNGRKMYCYTMGHCDGKVNNFTILHTLIENYFHCKAWTVVGWRPIELT